VKKRTVPIALIMALLFLAAAERLYVDVGKAAFWSVPELPPPIYIQSDGSIEPPSDCIQQVGDTYILTRDIDNSIEVQRDHIVIDGNGFSITQIPINTSGFMIPAGFYPGIRLNDRINLTVQNVKIHACFSGITLERAKNITLTNNSIASIGKIAIFSGSSSNCTFSQNDIIGNDQGILIINSTRIHISENNIKRNRIGIQISSSGYPNHYVAITRNNISGSTDTGIAVYGGFQIIIVGNNIADNGRGLFVSYTDCTVHHNNFVNNAESVDSSSCPGPWDEGGEGNHWSDYNGTDVNSDGIGDTPYVVETPWTWVEPTTNTSVTYGVNAQDNYPLIAALNISSVIIELPEWSASPPPPLPSFLTPSPSPTPRSSTTPSPEPTNAPEQTEPFPTVLVVAASGASVAIIGIALLIYFKKRHKKSGDEK